MEIKRTSKGIAITVAVIGIMLIAILIYLANVYSNSTPRYFTSEKKGIAQKLYNEIIDYDFENDYPQSPEKVMELNNKIFLLLYGNMLINNDLLESLLVQQRQLYSDELLDKNPFDSQYDALVAALEQYRSLGSVCLDVTMDYPVALGTGGNKVSIEVTQYTNNLGELKWTYYLERTASTEKYKITGWISAGENK